MKVRQIRKYGLAHNMSHSCPTDGVIFGFISLQVFVVYLWREKKKDIIIKMFLIKYTIVALD